MNDDDDQKALPPLPPEHKLPMPSGWWLLPAIIIGGALWVKFFAVIGVL